jgi:putative ABC transport system permease protein
VVTALQRKLLRDLGRLRGQALSIALIIACGIASYVALYSTFLSLESGRDRYYEANRFADVFVHLKRAPNVVAARIGEIPGVAIAHAREVERITLPMEGMTEPASGRIITLPVTGVPPLNALHLRKGRTVEPGRVDEAVVLESFATAHGLEPGDRVPVIVNGVLRHISVVGLALSPEYVFPVGDLDPLPDPSRFAVLWMRRDIVAPSFQMEGAFNDLVLRLQPGADERQVLDAVDRIVEPYGGMSAYGRSQQLSNRFLAGELLQLGQMSTFIAGIFLGVAAFLVNVVMSRLVHLQRAQIATLRAIGYRSSEVGRHYLVLILVVALVGAIVGTGGGAYLGRGMMRLYEPYFHFPQYGYRLDTGVVATAVLVSLAAALVGGFATVRHAARLPPAEAMRPEAPPSYRPSILEKIGLGRLLSPSGRMVLRELTRRPLRTALSAFGIAMATAILIAARFSFDAIDGIMDLAFEQAQRDDFTVSFLRPLPDEARREIAHLPGVLRTEPLRMVPARLRAGPRKREVALTGLAPGAALRRVVEWPGRVVPLPERGMILTDKLAEVLDIRAGDSVNVEIMEGDRRSVEIHVAGVSQDLFGLQAYMSLDALRSTLGEHDVISAIALTVDRREEASVARRLKDLPAVASVTRRRAIIERFRRQMAENTGTTTFILVLFAGTIAAGVVYNNARIALSMRSRDLASLRVLGFTRAEISAVLLGELAVYVFIAVPLGLVLGTGLAHLVGGMVDPETYRLPVVISGRTYAFSVAVTGAAALLSAMVVRRKLDRLDLIGVLKTRE